MKLKLTLVILFFSFFLNISHDLFIAKELKKCDCDYLLVKKSLEESKKHCSKDLSSLHQLFHFSAILIDINMDFSPLKKRPLFFTKFILPSSIRESSFRPPRV